MLLAQLGHKVPSEFEGKEDVLTSSVLGAANCASLLRLTSDHKQSTRAKTGPRASFSSYRVA